MTDAGYRRYIKAFGYELALKGIELAEHFERLSTDTHADTVAVLTAQLHHLDESVIRRRMDSVVRFIVCRQTISDCRWPLLRDGFQFQPRRPFQIGTTAFAPASYVV